MNRNVIPNTLIIVGGVQTAIPLSEFAKTLGYRVLLIEPRSAFADKSRFPQVDQIYQAWPDEVIRNIKIDESTAFAILTHDPKIDDPALVAALDSSAFYIGALGSKKTQTKRRDRLLKSEVSQQKIDKLIGPIGLDIGSQTP